MLTHDAVLWQYVSCVVNAEIAEADLALHALPLYHCAQLDVFFGPGDLHRLHQRHHGQAGARQPAAADREAPHHQLLCAAHRLDRAAALAAVRHHRPVQPGKGYYGASIMPVEVLRELARPAAEGAPVEPLRPDRDCAAGHHAGPGRPAAQARLGRPGRSQRGNPRGDDDMRDVAVGEVGEIVHRSPHLMLGYFNDPSAPPPRSSGGWFHSGDLATIDDEGYITVVDRKKDMIKTGGENVASREVEEMIYRLPQVSEVAVIGLPDRAGSRPSPRWSWSRPARPDRG
jgi:fatty-acyl-CoA synthase